MNEKIIVVDDLYDTPYHYHRGFFENECVITDETIGKISQILDRPISITEATNEEGTNSGVVAHLGCDWIAVIYMSLPLEIFGELGIKFYSHKHTGLEAFPTQDEIKSLHIDDNNLESIFDSDLNLWKEYGCIPAKYNRLVMFKGNQWHSYGLNNSIKYQKIFVNHV
jgi:hypothetical protein